MGTQLRPQPIFKDDTLAAAELPGRKRFEEPDLV